MKKLIVAASVLALAGAATAQAGSKPSDGAKHSNHSDHVAPTAAPTPAPTPAPSPSPEPTPAPTPTAPAPTGPTQ